MSRFHKADIEMASLGSVEIKLGKNNDPGLKNLLDQNIDDFLESNLDAGDTLLGSDEDDIHDSS